MLFRRPQILSDRQHVDVVRPHVAKDLEQLLVGLAEANHQSRLGHHVGRQRLDVAQQCEAVRVDRLGPDPRVQTGHRLGVVVEDVRPRLDHCPDGGEIALEVRGEHLDRRPRASPPDRSDRAGEDPRATVLQVVAVD